MKLTCAQADLRKGLATAGHALSGRATLPILSCLHLSAETERLALRATNLEIGISCDLPALVEEAGSIALPARLLTDFVNSLPEGDVTISLTEETFTALIVGSRSRAHIRGMDPGEYPALESLSESDALSRFEAAHLKDAITQVAFAAADDDSRPVLTAVLLRGRKDAVTLAAADAFRLAVREVASIPTIADVNGAEEQLQEGLLIPAKTLTELARILPPDGEVTLSAPAGRHLACFQTEHLTLVTRLLEGQFPDYARIIPTAEHTRAVVETAEFRSAVKAVALFARDNSNMTHLRIQPGNEQEAGALIIEASSNDLGDTVSTLPASVAGDELTLLFNATYLQEILAAIPTPETVLVGTSSSKPGVFHPVGELDATYVVMPMSINR